MALKIPCDEQKLASERAASPTTLPVGPLQFSSTQRTVMVWELTRSNESFPFMEDFTHVEKARYQMQYWSMIYRTSSIVFRRRRLPSAEYQVRTENEKVAQHL